MACSRDTASGITTPVPLRAALPADRAFVVQLRADADLARGVIRGRVEHVVSGAAALFDSVENLLAWIEAETSADSVRSRSPLPSARISAGDPEPAAGETVGVTPANDGRKEPAT